jgi:hypothetical protein
MHHARDEKREEDLGIARDERAFREAECSIYEIIRWIREGLSSSLMPECSALSSIFVVH